MYGIAGAFSRDRYCALNPSGSARRTRCSKADSVLPGVIPTFNARWSLRCAECSSGSRYWDWFAGIIVYPRTRTWCVHHVMACIKFERRKKVAAARSASVLGPFVPLQERNDREHSARFVGPYATGPVGFRASRARRKCVCVPSDTPVRVDEWILGREPHASFLIHVDLDRARDTYGRGAIKHKNNVHSRLWRKTSFASNNLYFHRINVPSSVNSERKLKTFYTYGYV